MTESDFGWVPVPDYEGFYEVHPSGLVRNAKTLAKKFYHLDEKGYPRLFLYKDGRRRGVRLHHILARAFVDGEREGLEVRHLNDIKTDFRLENLQWGTRGENVKDQVRNGLHNMASREFCVRGHRLDGENLLPETPGRRVCRKCSYNARDASKLKFQKKGLAPGDPRHGTLYGHHDFACRCDLCLEAYRAYRREYRARKKLERARVS